MLAMMPKRPLRPTKVFKPLPWQITPWRDKSFIMLLTGSAGGGKSKLAMEKINGYCLKYPGAFALLLRKVKVSMTSGSALFFEDDVTVAAAEGTFSGARHLPSKSRFEYANGSMVVYMGLEDRKQLERLKSIGRKGGVDIAFMEEATEFEESDFNAVIGRMRGQVASWRQIILACNPDAPTHWINRRLILGEEASLHYSAAADNTYNPDDYVQNLERLTGVDYLRLVKGQWVQAAGMVYDSWSEQIHVTPEADYIPGGGQIYWAVDDGYSGGSAAATNGLDRKTNTFVADAHPRVFLLCQLRQNGTLVVFDESYRCKMLSDNHIEAVSEFGYPMPSLTVVDKAAAELRGRLIAGGYPVLKSKGLVEEGIKEVRGWITPDENNVTRLLVHPRCRHLRQEMVSYVYDDNDKVVKAYDHGPDALRYLLDRLKYNR